MNFVLKVVVNGNYKDVMAGFDRQLFEALKPTIGKMEIVEFTGSRKGDIVHMRFLSPVKTEWISNIVEDKITEKRAWFVDVGTKLPWPIATWTHRHIVEKIDESHSRIVDDISFTGTNFLFSLFLYPAILLGFYPRKKIYKNYFNKGI